MARKKFVGFRAESELYDELKEQSRREETTVSRFVRNNIRKLLMDNKGDVAGIIFIIIVCFLVALSGIIGLSVLGQFNGQLQKIPLANESGATNATGAVISSFETLDQSFPLLFIGANMVILFLSFRANTHPVMFIFILFMLVILVYVASIFADTYYAISTSTQMVNASHSMDVTQYLMNNIVFMQVIFGFIDAIVMFSMIGKEK